MSAPLFSVIMATYGRGRHIAPSVASVLRQSCQDFELIVVSDGPARPVEMPDVPLPAGRFTCLELPENSGSQAAPNNAGIGAAKGEWIAYLGHDDVWSGVHLERLAAVISAGGGPDVVVSGCLYHGPAGTGIRYVNGFFEATDEAAKFRYFFPPSSVAHRREVTELVGPWRDPRTIAAPDDAEFMLRVAATGMHFVSTNQATVHKFAAGHRYLSYICQASDEQAAMLRNDRLDRPEAWAPELAQARRDGGFMTMCHDDYAALEIGARFAMNRANKGLERVALTRLEGKTTLPQNGEVRALDWYGLEPGAPAYRWSGPNPRPKLLLPLTYRGWARIMLRMPHGTPAPAGVAVFAAGRRLKAKVTRGANGEAIVIRVRLDPAWYTVLELYTPVMGVFSADDQRRRGIAVADVIVAPATWGLAIRRWFRLVFTRRPVWLKGGAACQEDGEAAGCPRRG